MNDLAATMIKEAERVRAMEAEIERLREALTDIAEGTSCASTSESCHAVHQRIARVGIRKPT